MASQAPRPRAWTSSPRRACRALHVLLGAVLMRHCHPRNCSSSSWWPSPAFACLGSCACFLHRFSSVRRRVAREPGLVFRAAASGVQWASSKHLRVGALCGFCSAFSRALRSACIPAVILGGEMPSRQCRLKLVHFSDVFAYCIFTSFLRVVSRASPVAMSVALFEDTAHLSSGLTLMRWRPGVLRVREC